MDVQQYYAGETIEATIDFKHGDRTKNVTITFAHIVHQDRTPQLRLRQQRPLPGPSLRPPQVCLPVVLWLVYPVEHHPPPAGAPRTGQAYCSKNTHTPFLKFHAPLSEKLPKVRFTPIS